MDLVSIIGFFTITKMRVGFEKNNTISLVFFFTPKYPPKGIFAYCLIFILLNTLQVVNLLKF